MLKKLKDFFRREQPTGRVYDLTDAQFLALKRLAADEDYRVWQEVLDSVSIILSEQFLAASDPFRLAQLQGTLLGIRRAGSLVDEVLQYELHQENERSRQSKQQPARNPAHARSALYGTPAGSTVFSR